MTYENIRPAVFLDRPNRFIAHVLLDGEAVVCHVKNTGRCRELLVPGCTVYVQHCPGPGRKTAYDLIAVQKGSRLINMDAAAPNRVFVEWLAAGGAGFIPGEIRPEYRHGDSRFDFFFVRDGRRCLAEIKGVTLEENGIARFPDAPTERGVKHLHGLAQAVREGWEAWAVFIIQMEGVQRLEPNWATHAAFGEAMCKAQEAGVRLLALDCSVEPDRLCVRSTVPVFLAPIPPGGL